MLREPRRLVADHLRVNHLGNVTADGVECQCRRILFLTTDLAIGNQSQLDQGLEAVADTQGQSISLIQKTHNGLFDLCILEGRRKEFRGAIRLVACGETAGEHDDLGLIDGFFKNIDRIADILCSQVLEYLYIHLCPCVLKGFGAVILAVGAGEYRDKYAGFRDLVFAYIDAFCLIAGIRIE